MRFLVRIRGARTPPPRIDEPVMKMPLGSCGSSKGGREGASVSRTVERPQPLELEAPRAEGKGATHHPAPRTERPMHRPTPMSAQK